MNNLKNAFGIGLLACILITSSFTTSEEFLTTIIVVDGKALLVDVDEHGEVVKTYMEVPDYLTSNKEHNEKVKEARANYIRLSRLQMDQIRFITVLKVKEEYKSVMRSNLADLASHYHQTYANEIIITVAQSNSNEDVMIYNLSLIKEELSKHEVSAADIKVEYKQDLGDAPSPFIKVASRLSKLTDI